MSQSDSADRTAAAPDPGALALGPLDALGMAAWCGLAAGLLEVGAIVLKAHTFGRHGFYHMSRHFVWAIPVGNLVLFLGLGTIFAAAVRLRPVPGTWLATRLLAALTILPILLVALPQIYPAASLVLALGTATRLVPILERHARPLRGALPRTFPLLAVGVAVLAGNLLVRDRLDRAREARRPLPPPGSPNVLLIVLDTVRADHLSVHGYGRPTSPNLEHLAREGVRFDTARATAPWTLPSHASMFTGRWPHELSASARTPLDAAYPTLAEYLGTRGYATAGFVANTGFCAYDSGLKRGFTHYEDHPLKVPRNLRDALLNARSLFRKAGLVALSGRLLSPLARSLRWRSGAGGDLMAAGIKPLVWPNDATAINRGALAWLSDRAEPERPFFLFLNYMEGHDPYEVPRDGDWRFGPKPRDRADVDLLDHWYLSAKRGLSPRQRALVRDGYDNCLAYLDAQLGRLFGELRRRGALDRTLVIVTADHGETFDEHGLHGHGVSLYQPELHVPLLVRLPGRAPAGRVVTETVSLRALPATIVDVLGLRAGAPFPGRSLAWAWTGGPPTLEPALSELERDPAVVHGLDPHRTVTRDDRLVALAEGNHVYIRNLTEGREELYDLARDPGQYLDLSRTDGARPDLERLRAATEALMRTTRRP